MMFLFTLTACMLGCMLGIVLGCLFIDIFFTD